MFGKCALVVALLALLFATSAHAVVVSDISLSDMNSTAKISPTSQSGISNWTVDVANQMNRSSYWYRTTDTAGVASGVSSLSYTGFTAIGSDEAILYYTGTGFNLQIDYTLYGSDAGSGTSDIHEIVKVTNTSASTLSMHLFEYVDANLNGTAAGDTATHVNSSTISQAKGNAQFQISGNPVPKHYEIGDAATLYNKLSSTSFTNLADATTPYTGDAAFALQWDLSIAKSGSLSVSPDMQVSGALVPEPSSMMALLGGFGLLPLLRRKNR